MLAVSAWAASVLVLMMRPQVAPQVQKALDIFGHQLRGPRHRVLTLKCKSITSVVGNENVESFIAGQRRVKGLQNADCVVID